MLGRPDDPSWKFGLPSSPTVEKNHPRSTTVRDREELPVSSLIT